MGESMEIKFGHVENTAASHCKECAKPPVICLIACTICFFVGVCIGGAKGYQQGHLDGKFEVLEIWNANILKRLEGAKSKPATP